MTRFRLACYFSTLVAVTVCGCDGGPKLYPVSGAVTFDGAPLPAGDILLIPADPTLGAEPGTIKDGKYELKARAGNKRVSISASKILPGGAKGAGGEPVPEEYVPAKYNSDSKLTIEVTSSGDNKFDFALESK